jgi:hypothetical protein
MTVLIAAIDESAAALPVLQAAQRIAVLVDARVEAVHVREDGSGKVATAIAEQFGVPLRVRDGEIVAVLKADVRDSDAIGLMIGLRGLPGGASPAGHVALDLVQSLDRPIVVVPPYAHDRPIRRVLVAVEGDGESDALRGLFERLGDSPIPEVIALHVLGADDLPMFADSPVLEAEAFRREFVIRAASGIVADPSRVRVELRIGDAPAVLRETTRELDVDLVVLAWHGSLSHGHGRIVREALAEASVPIALFASNRHNRDGPSPD